MFATSVIRHTVKLKAKDVGANVREVVEDRARAVLEGVCGESGFVRPNTLRMVSMSHGMLGDIDMGRSYSFDATFKAEVCNPVRGLRLNALVRSINRFGMMCEGGYYDPDNSLVPVLEIVVVRNPAKIPNEVDLDEVQIGDEVGVEVLGRSFELRDSRISAFGRTVRLPAGAGLLPTHLEDEPAEGAEAEAGETDLEDEGDEDSDEDDEASRDGEAEDLEPDEYGTGEQPEERGGDEFDGMQLPDVDVEDEGFDLKDEADDEDARAAE